MPTSKEYSLPEQDNNVYSYQPSKDDISAIPENYETKNTNEGDSSSGKVVDIFPKQKATQKSHDHDSSNATHKEHVDNDNNQLIKTPTKKVQTSVQPMGLGSNGLNAPNTKSSKKELPKERREIDADYRDYVSHNDVNKLGSYFRGTQATELGDWGEKTVIEAIEKQLKLSDGHKIINQAPKNNPGFDLVVLNENRDIIRRIEVKTMSGPWGTRGYYLSKTQVRHAIEDKDWSLFVVLNANNPNVQASIQKIRNPFDTIQKFFFPNAWEADDEHKNVQVIPIKI